VSVGGQFLRIFRQPVTRGRVSDGATVSDTSVSVTDSASVSATVSVNVNVSIGQRCPFDRAFSHRLKVVHRSCKGSVF
jgi:hypothetical protein